MKKSLITLLIFALSYSVSAQSMLGTKVVGGIALPSVSAPFTINSGMSYSYGFAYKYQFAKFMAAEGDLLGNLTTYTVQTNADQNVTTISNLNLRVPLVVQFYFDFKDRKKPAPYRLPKLPRHRWYTEIGPILEYAISSKAYVPTSGEFVDPNKFNVGLTAGAGIDFSLREQERISRITVGIKYNKFFLNAYKPTTGGPVMTMSNIGLQVQADFNLSRKKHYRHRW